MSKIKIFDIYGQDTGTEHYFVYSTEPDSGSWKTRIDELRTYLSNEVTSCYMTWCMKDYGWWLSKAIYSPSRGGHLMFSVCIGSYRPKDGHQAIALLDELANYFSSSENWNSENAYSKINDLEYAFDVVPCETVDFAEPSLPPKAAYWSYDTPDQLATMLTFIRQNRYEGFSRVFFISQNQVDGMMPSLENLNGITKIKKTYSLTLPNDGSCRCDKMELFEDETAQLTFIKNGMNSQTVTITGGKPSPYCLVDDNNQEMCIQSSANAGIRFTRPISITCSDQNGHTYENFGLRANDPAVEVDPRNHTVTISENYKGSFELYLTANDNSFKQKTERIHPSQISGKVFDIKVEPSAYSVVFIMEGERFESKKTMNPANVEKWEQYNPEVREDAKTIEFTVPASGKARRTKSGESFVSDTPKIVELLKKYWYAVLLGLLLIYAAWGVVSLIAGNGWPGFGKKETTIRTETSRQQLIDNMSTSDIWKRDQIPSDLQSVLYDNIYNGNYTVFFSEVGNGNQVKDTLFNFGHAKINPKWTRMIDDLQFIRTEGQTAEGTEIRTKINSICSQAGYVDLAKIVQATGEMKNRIDNRKRQQEAELKEKDLDYMKHSDIWTRINLKTAEYQELFDKITEGDIEYLLPIAQDIDNQPKEKTNGYWIAICHELTAMAGNETKLERAKEVLISNCANGSINLNDIWKKLQSINNPSGGTIGSGTSSTSGTSGRTGGSSGSGNGNGNNRNTGGGNRRPTAD